MTPRQQRVHFRLWLALLPVLLALIVAGVALRPAPAIDPGIEAAP